MPSSGPFAPWSIHARSVATSAALRRGFLGGIRTSGSSDVTSWNRWLSAAFPGVIALPPSPPANASTLRSSRRLLFAFSAPWQETQCFAKIGFTSRSKSIGFGGGSAARLPGATGQARSAATSATYTAKRTIISGTPGGRMFAAGFL